ncbi:MAG: glycosyl transferase [Desulfobacterales bacterium CG23_combo_of_CG06-09_8_20_14_all_51_8]|nr:MAG: glycosyl transferase [Desulfobacterales bacterium CG23_combo_of_CG06-09_8_20_14_all_51_8]
MKVDLHVHSKSSTRPSQWILQKIDCPESFTSQKKIYEIAKARGMDLVTITDHNNINGCLEIAHLPDVFISEEATAYFPENQCKLHVLVHDITEDQHIEIHHLRKNVYDLVAYLNRENLFHVLAHPLFDLNHKLSLDYFEKMLLLFTNFEVNGSRDAHQNEILTAILKSLTPKDMELLADKHGVLPQNPRPWIKNITAGSDDHSSLNIARMHTCVPDAETKEQFFAGILSGRATVSGKPATPKTMAHNLYGIAYQFYKSKFDFDRYITKNTLFKFVDSALTHHEDHRGMLTRLQDYIITRRPSFSMFHSRSGDLVELIQEKAMDAIRHNINFQKILNDTGRESWEKEEDWFAFVNDVSEAVMKSFADAALDSLSRARLFNIFQTIGSAGSVYTLLAPYFMAFGLFTKDRAFAESCRKRFLSDPKEVPEEETRMVIFTDTLSETNGVALTLRMQLKIAQKTGKHLSLVTCSPDNGVEGAKNFTPIGSFQIPEYPEISLHYPPVLKMLEYCYENNFIHIMASTPGPMGLAALAVSRILDIPFYGTYHTAFPQYVAELTDDFAMEELAWKLMVWFYNQMDIVYVPSRATGAELAAKGIRPSKLRLYPRGIDIHRFHPAQRNGFWSSKYQLPGKSTKLLYVGRVSKEKNLDVLARAFNKLNLLNPDLQLIIVGDGPYRKDMEKALEHTNALFTGYLEGDDLVKAYASSDLFVFPSSTDTFGNVVLEAQACGLPVIVTDAGGPQENLVDGETGIIVPAHEDQALIDAVLQICETPQRLAMMKLNARKYMENRSFEDAFNQNWEMYHAKPAVEKPSPDNVAQWFKFAS